MDTIKSTYLLLGCRSGFSRRRCLERCNGCRLFNHGRVLIDLGGMARFLLSLGLEETADASREATADLGGSLGLLLLLLDLLLFLL